MQSGGSPFNFQTMMNPSFWANLPGSTTTPAAKPPPNPKYVYQSQSMPVNKKIQSSIGEGYRYGTSDDPASRAQGILSLANKNVAQFKNSAKPVWTGPDVDKTKSNAEYGRMNPYGGYDKYQADVKKFDAQQAAAAQQQKNLKQSVGGFVNQQHGYRFDRNSNPQAQPQGYQSGQGRANVQGGIRSLPTVGQTRWNQ